MENKINAIDAFSNGGIIMSRLYTALFNQIPSTHRFNDDTTCEGLDLKHISPEDIKPMLIGNIYEQKIFTYEILKDNDAPLDWHENDSGDVLNDTSNSEYTFIGNRIVWNIRPSAITVNYDCSLFNVNDIINCCSKIYKELPKLKPLPKEASVHLIKVSQGDYYTEVAKINKTTINIEENYNDDFQQVHDDVVSFLNCRSSGLVLLYGEMGSGNYYKNNLYNY